MGVGMARKVVRGGTIEEPDNNVCDIGNSLRHRVDVFIGISGMQLYIKRIVRLGANYGMCQCGSGYLEGPPQWPTCNTKVSLYVLKD